jgi:hypothetical protein
MRWREVLAGAAVTLIVTIFAGVIVWLITREPRSQPANEKLQYSLEDPAAFTAGQTRIALLTFRLANVGTKSATDVHVVALFKLGVEIREKQISLSSGLAGNFTATVDVNRLEIVLPTLAPAETLTVSLLVSGATDIKPEIGVRSRDSVGVPGETQKAPEPRNRNFELIAFLLVLAGSLMVAMGLWVLLFTRIRRTSNRLRDPAFHLNDTAFVYIQIGLVSEAKKILSDLIDRYGGESVIISNYALTLGLTGDEENAEKLFHAAEWWSRDDLDKAIINYDKAIWLISQKKLGAAKEHLAIAFRFSKKEILRYCGLNLSIKEAAEEDPSIKSLIEEQGKDERGQ